MSRSCWFVLAGWGFVISTSDLASAQQVYVTAPSVNTSDGFYEWYGIDWGFSARGRNSLFFFNRGGSMGTIPPFGGFDPSSAARLGFSSQAGNLGFFFNLGAAQGSNRSISSSSPSVTMQNGQVGALRDTTLRPFVTGLVPVVGSGVFGLGSCPVSAPPTLISPLEQRLARLQAGETPPRRSTPPDDDPSDLVLGSKSHVTASSAAPGRRRSSSAERGDIGVAEIRQQQDRAEAEQRQQLRSLVEEAETAERVGRWGVARIRYRKAADRADGELRQKLLDKAKSLQGK